MIFSRSAMTLPQAAGPILSQPGNGELGIPLLIPIIAGGALILGGGTLWQFHEKREEKSDYLKCVQTYSNAPYNMSPQEAALVCGGDVEGGGGFKFGLNAQSFILIAASVFGMWFVTQLMITAAKSRIGGRK